MPPKTPRISRGGAINPHTQPNQNLARGLLILEAFTEEYPQWGVRDLARALKTNPATMHRLLTTLENFGYVEQDKETHRYRLGPKIVGLADVYIEQNPLPVVARRVFEEFSNRYEHSFYLGVLSNSDVVYIAVLDGRGALKISMEPGGRTALYSTGMGKVLLAFQDDKFIETFLASVPLKANTRRTITSPQRLWKEIREIRRLGYAVNYGEHFEEIGAIGLPLRNTRGEIVAGFSLGFPMHWLTNGRIDIESLRQLSAEIVSTIQWQMEGRAG